MFDRAFPVQPARGALPHPMSIPWSVAELAYGAYVCRYGQGQSLERLAERGGFTPGELDVFVPDWRARCDENARLRAALAHAQAEVEVLKSYARHAQECIAAGTPPPLLGTWAAARALEVTL